MKIRIEGTVPELDAAVARLRREFFIQSVSRPYKNRNSELCRVYVEAELAASGDPELTPSPNGEQCQGNGRHPGIERCCDECDHFQTCFPGTEQLIQSCAADLAFEGLPVTDENVAAMRRIASGETTLAAELAALDAKYKAYPPKRG